MTGRYLGPDIESDDYYASVAEWIEECSAHPKCSQTVSGIANINPRNSTLPSRCIELSAGGERAVLSETEGQAGCYITLTHRWNEETEASKTTTSNYRDRLNGFEVQTLPKLYRDVFTIAKKFQVRHVWIDSICIIQDQDDDWKRESPKMAQYYQYSLFTIAGTMPNMADGLLRPYKSDPTPWESKLVRLPYRDKRDAQAGYFYVYRRRARLVDDYWDLVRSSILFRRGWVLQEWLLSKRILWYTPRGLFLECHTLAPRTPCREMIQLEMANQHLRSHLQLKQSFHFTGGSILDIWYRTLEVYTACHLKEPDKDRILALGGLAREIQHIIAKQKWATMPSLGRMNNVYVSGLWLRDIHHGLLWEEGHSAQPWTTRVADAPSWSWSSLMTPVNWPERCQGTTKAFKLTGVCLKEEDGNEGRRIIYYSVNQVQSNNELQGPLFGLKNMFCRLHIKGKLCIVHVRGYLETAENLRTAANFTAYSTTPITCRWRAICSPERPEVIAGWGSLEQLGPEDGTSCADFGVAVCAFHVSTRFRRSGSLIPRALPVLDVLFLKKDGEGAYKRVGVGRIADETLIKEFLRCDDQEIQLV